MITACKVLLSK